MPGSTARSFIFPPLAWASCPGWSPRRTRVSDGFLRIPPGREPSGATRRCRAGRSPSRWSDAASLEGCPHGVRPDGARSGCAPRRYGSPGPVLRHDRARSPGSRRSRGSSAADDRINEILREMRHPVVACSRKREWRRRHGHGRCNNRHSRDSGNDAIDMGRGCRSNRHSRDSGNPLNMSRFCTVGAMTEHGCVGAGHPVPEPAGEDA